MASAEQIRELQRKLDALIAERFGRNAWAQAFRARELELWLSPEDVARISARLEAQRQAKQELEARLLAEWAELLAA